MAFKAEVVLAVLVVVRHRAARLAAVLVLCLLPLAVQEAGRGARTGDLGGRMVLMIGGMLASVFASRPLAPGGALSAARRAGASSWLPAVGRLTGVLCLIVPALLVAAVVLYTPAALGDASRAVLVGTGYAASVGALILAATPSIGASAAASLGLLAVWFGSIPPSGVIAALDGWPSVRDPIVQLWNSLPLPWRAVRWMAGGEGQDALILGLWTTVGLCGSAVHVVRRPGTGGRA